MENGDAAKGERMFWAGGCASCHAAKGAKGEAKKSLGGGLALVTPFGTFHAPNISPDKLTGIGGWTGENFANAMLYGVSPQGSHYYPAFPFTSYTRMQAVDVADLWAFLKGLPAVAHNNIPHALPLPFRLRRGLGLWKLLFLDQNPVAKIDSTDKEQVLGRYLVEGPGHCAECHTPRNLIGGADKSRWLAGAVAPEGKGRIPNITTHENGIGHWSRADVESYLEIGFTPEFDAVGGAMAAVQENMAKLPPADRQAIAAYLRSLVPVPN